MKNKLLNILITLVSPFVMAYMFICYCMNPSRDEYGFYK